MARTHLTKSLLDKSMKSLDNMDSWSEEELRQYSLKLLDKGLIQAEKLTKQDTKKAVCSMEIDSFMRA
ncbi:TPA: hypothetical protein I7141_12885 [Vibrio vulnificus]|nr:hypothetical protein [Vibrio parahaemolyticus]HAS6076778.1 hypothetical protein [Vibrio vulnificus]